MRRVAEGIYRRDSGRYVVPIYDPATGNKRYSHPRVPRGGFATLEEARAFKRWLADDREEAAAALTCGEFARSWTRTHPRGESTNQHNGERVRAFVRDFDGMSVRDVTPQMARLWTFGGPAPKMLEKTVAGWKGVKRVDGELVVPSHESNYRAVRAMFSDIVRDGVLDRSPFSALGVSEGKGRRDAVMLTAAELELLVDCAGEEWGVYGETVVGPMIAVAAGTGMRPGELRAMRWSWIDWEADAIEVRAALNDRTGKETRPKSGRGPGHTRTVAMLPMVREALRKVPRDAEHVFTTQNGSLLRQRTHWYYWNPVRSRFHGRLPAGRREVIPGDFDWYELRHYFGSYLASRGVSPYDIADQMGHVDGGVLAQKTYIHTESEDARARVLAAVSRLDDPPSVAREGG
jgi:integrase